MPWARLMSASRRRPDPLITPGQATDGIVNFVRDVPAEVKRQVFAAYQISLLRRPLYVIDHLIPLELGGTNSPLNLWPQPRRQAKLKDRDENRLAAEVRAGRLGRAAAQQEILRLWGAS